MPFLNPVVDKFRVDFSAGFYPKSMTERYNRYLRTKNAPLKTIQDVIAESIVGLQIPGFEFQQLNVTDMPNLGKDPYKGEFPTVVTQITYPQDTSKMATFTSQVVTLTLQNNLLNWLYFYEMYNAFFKNNRTVDFFSFFVTMLDASEIEIFRFRFEGCFCSGMAGLDISSNEEFMQSKTVDVSILFNSMEVDTLIPDFNLKTVNLK